MDLSLTINKNGFEKKNREIFASAMGVQPSMEESRQ